MSDWKFTGEENILRAYKYERSAFGFRVSALTWARGNGERKCQGNVSLVPIYGCAPSIFSVFAALYTAPDALGPRLMDLATVAHWGRSYPWRVETRKGMSGCTDISVRVQDEVSRDLGLAGRVTSRIHISCANKFNQNQGFRVPLEDWYVFVNEVAPRLEDTLWAIRGLYPKGSFTPMKTGQEYCWSEPGTVYGFGGPEPGLLDRLVAKVAPPRERLHFEDEGGEQNA